MKSILDSTDTVVLTDDPDGDDDDDDDDDDDHDDHDDDTRGDADRGDGEGDDVGYEAGSCFLRRTLCRSFQKKRNLKGEPGKKQNSPFWTPNGSSQRLGQLQDSAQASKSCSARSTGTCPVRAAP